MQASETRIGRVLNHVGAFLSTNPSPSPALTPDRTLYEGDLFVFEGLQPLRSVPAGRGWRWNQTKGKKEIPRPDGGLLCVTQVVPRKHAFRNKPAANSLPPYCFWHLLYTGDDGVTTVLWCEKGPLPPISSLVPPFD